MKKVITIIVLGLLWCNIGYGASTYKFSILFYHGNFIIYKLKLPAFVNDTKWNNTFSAMWEDALNICPNINPSPIMFMNGNTWDQDKRDLTNTKFRFYCGNGIKQSYRGWKRNYENIFYSEISEVTHYSMSAGPVKEISKIIEEISEAENKLELASMIGDAKKTCKELGFTEGTDKFADCSLKLYSQSVELAAKNNQTVVMQPQSSGSNSITIYDPVRDSNALIRQGQRMLSGACTLGINC